MPDVRVLRLRLLPALPVALVALVVYPCRVHPQLPIRRLPVQHVSRQYPIPGGVLDVDVQVGAPHRDRGIEVDLHRVRYPLLHAELLRLDAPVPGAELGGGKEGGERDQEDGCVTAACRAPGEGRLCFSWEERWVVSLDLGCLCRVVEGNN